MANSNRGFASMVQKDPTRQRRIASLGGKRAHQLGTAHEFDHLEAKNAGRKGGQISGKLRSEAVYHQLSATNKSQKNLIDENVDLSNQKNIDIYLVDIKEGD